jgi:hypothetical protein
VLVVEAGVFAVRPPTAVVFCAFAIR